MDNAYDHGNWYLVLRLMHTMGLGPRMPHLIFLLGKNIMSKAMLNGGFTSNIAHTSFVYLGCPPSQLLFTLVNTNCVN